MYFGQFLPTVIREVAETLYMPFVRQKRYAELGQTSAELVHEIANPLTSATLQLELLQQRLRGGTTDDHSELHDRLHTILSSLEHIRFLVRSSQEQLRDEHETSCFSAYESLITITKILQMKAAQRDVTLEIRRKHDALLIGNEVRFQQVLKNIIVNAIEAYESDGKENEKSRRVVITLSQEFDQFHLTVQDWGSGIPRSFQHKVFQANFSSKGRAGQGIGLSLAKRMVEEYFQGTINFRSREGMGTTFFLKLPLTPTSSSPLPQPVLFFLRRICYNSPHPKTAPFLR